MGRIGKLRSLWFSNLAKISNQPSPNSKQNVLGEGTQFPLPKKKMEHLYKLLKLSQDTNTLLLAQIDNFFLVLNICTNDLEP